MKNKVTSIIVGILIYCSSEIFATVMGPVNIDLIGYDTISNTIYFTKTNWSEFDCETDLYKYHISDDSLQIITAWVQKSSYFKNRNGIITEKGLDYLIAIDTFSGSLNTYKFSWLPEITTYSPVVFKDVINYPFKIQIGDKEFIYTQCYTNDKLPIIQEFHLYNNIGLVLIKYKGECIEGNTIDILLFFKKGNKGIDSRELIPSDYLL